VEKVTSHPHCLHNHEPAAVATLCPKNLFSMPFTTKQILDTHLLTF